MPTRDRVRAALPPPATFAATERQPHRTAALGALIDTEKCGNPLWWPSATVHHERHRRRDPTSMLRRPLLRARHEPTMHPLGTFRFVRSGRPGHPFNEEWIHR